MTRAPPGIVAATDMSAGTVTTGDEPGETVTVNDAEPVTPAPVVALHVTGVAPIPNVEPEAGAQVTGSVPPAGSVAVGTV